MLDAFVTSQASVQAHDLIHPSTITHRQAILPLMQGKVGVTCMSGIFQGLLLILKQGSRRPTETRLAMLMLDETIQIYVTDAPRANEMTGRGTGAPRSDTG
jgi:hypothetical protein